MLEPLSQNGCNNKEWDATYNVTVACFSTACEIVNRCDVFSLHCAESVLPNQVSIPFVGFKSVLETTEWRIKRVLLPLCWWAHALLRSMWSWRLLLEARQDDHLDARRRYTLDMASVGSIGGRESCWCSLWWEMFVTLQMLLSNNFIFFSGGWSSQHLHDNKPGGWRSRVSQWRSNVMWRKKWAE